LEFLRQSTIFKPLGYMDNSPQPSGQVSAPTFQQMQTLSTFYKRNLITLGPWENYDAERISKFLAKIDWNINDNNTF
jgi:hypothetical protein